jgi:hypothetical protein
MLRFFLCALIPFWYPLHSGCRLGMFYSSTLRFSISLMQRFGVMFVTLFPD